MTELIASQAKTLAVMFCAGVAVESLWQIKVFFQNKMKIVPEILFWTIAGVTLMEFLYYCTYGKITVYGMAGFLAGLLLWKKICCVILKEVWVEKEEAENLKTTAGLSALKMQENNGWKRGRQKRKKKKNV